jgi:hypothetical protein
MVLQMELAYYPWFVLGHLVAAIYYIINTEMLYYVILDTSGLYWLNNIFFPQKSYDTPGFAPIA